MQLTKKKIFQERHCTALFCLPSRSGSHSQGRLSQASADYVNVTFEYLIEEWQYCKSPVYFPPLWNGFWLIRNTLEDEGSGILENFT